MPGYFLPIIPRNTTIPVSREEIVSTVQANQRELLIKVYQGESRRVEGNLLLGELRVTGIPPGPAGIPVCIRLTYDLNGILEVESFVREGGQRFRTVLTQHVKGLNPQQMDEAIRNLSKLKFYPRDDERNQHLLLFCERVLGEINPHFRPQLEEAIDGFEQGLSAGDPQVFEHYRHGLLLMLSSLGIEYSEHNDSAEEPEI